MSAVAAAEEKQKQRTQAHDILLEAQSRPDESNDAFSELETSEGHVSISLAKERHGVFHSGRSQILQAHAHYGKTKSLSQDPLRPRRHCR
jgi:hypothetical protein